jgi:hypothetical protein
MSSQRHLTCILIVLIAAAILAAGCTMQATSPSPKAAADAARAQADMAFAAGNYHAAETFYALGRRTIPLPVTRQTPFPSVTGGLRPYA